MLSYRVYKCIGPLQVDDNHAEGNRDGMDGPPADACSCCPLQVKARPAMDFEGVITDGEKSPENPTIKTRTLGCN